MICKNVTVKGTISPALIVQCACMFDSKTLIRMDEKEMNAKSLLGMMSLTIVKGDNLDIVADGKDESEAVEALERSFTAGKSRKVG